MSFIATLILTLFAIPFFLRACIVIAGVRRGKFQVKNHGVPLLRADNPQFYDLAKALMLQHGYLCLTSSIGLFLLIVIIQIQK